MLNSLVFTEESGGVLHAHLSSSKTAEEAQENLERGDGEASKVLGIVLLNETDSRMRAVAEVLEMVLELDFGLPNSATRSFLLEIFTAGRDSAKKK